MPSKKDILNLYNRPSLKLAQLLKDGVQMSVENHVLLIVQLAILQAKHSPLKKSDAKL